MSRDLRTDANANMVMSASRLVPLRRMAPAKLRRPPAPVVRPLFIPERTPWLPQSKGAWVFCGFLGAVDLAPFVFLAWRFL